MTTPSFSFFNEEQLERQNREKIYLRSNASYVGALSVTLTLVMQYAYSIIVKLLITKGLLSSESLAQPFLGMGNTQYLLFYAFVYTFSLLLPAVMVSYLHGKKFVPFSPAKPVSFAFGTLMVLAAVGMCMLSNIVNSVVSSFFRDMGANVPPPPQLMVNTPISFAINLLTIAVLPALLEEMIWRGYILRSLRGYGDGIALVVSALLFSLMHGNLRQIPFAFIVGLFLGYLYVQTNNIWIPIIVHFLNNGISVVMEYLSFSVSPAELNLIAFYMTYGLILAGLLASLLLVLLYGKKMKLNKSVSTWNAASRWRILWSSPLFVSSVLLYAAFVFLGM